MADGAFVDSQRDRTCASFVNQLRKVHHSAEPYFTDNLHRQRGFARFKARLFNRRSIGPKTDELLAVGSTEALVRLIKLKMCDLAVKGTVG